MNYRTKATKFFTFLLFAQFGLSAMEQNQAQEIIEAQPSILANATNQISKQTKVFMYSFLYGAIAMPMIQAIESAQGAPSPLLILPFLQILPYVGIIFKALPVIAPVLIASSNNNTNRPLLPGESNNLNRNQKITMAISTIGLLLGWLTIHALYESKGMPTKEGYAMALAKVFDDILWRAGAPGSARNFTQHMKHLLKK